jgi:hypothetical protein
MATFGVVDFSSFALAVTLANNITDADISRIEARLEYAVIGVIASRIVEVKVVSGKALSLVICYSSVVQVKHLSSNHTRWKFTDFLCVVD